MSTTTDRSVALRYGQDSKTSRGLNQVYEGRQDALNRGCMLKWLSQCRAGLGQNLSIGYPYPRTHAQ